MWLRESHEYTGSSLQIVSKRRVAPNGAKRASLWPIFAFCAAAVLARSAALTFLRPGVTRRPRFVGCLTCQQGACSLKSVNLLVDALHNSVEVLAEYKSPNWLTPARQSPELSEIFPNF